MPNTYYNDNEPYVAQWLRNLADGGQITPGLVDQRRIEEVQPHDVQTYARCHFFAGIGGWDLALQLAGWPADREVWTGSCPCQPFSVAGKRRGVADERHLWPEWFRLIRECRPATIFGEQVASRDGREWLSGVFADLEGVGYAVAGADLCAAGVGAPHIRQRLWWVAHSQRHLRDSGRLASQSRESVAETPAGACPELGRCGLPSGGLGQSSNEGLEGHTGDGSNGNQPGRVDAEPSRSTAETGWSDYEWLPCLDGKSRRIKPGLKPLAHGVPARVGKLRAYGNSIVPQVASEFIQAVMAYL